MRVLHVIYFAFLDQSGNHVAIVGEHLRLLREAGLCSADACAKIDAVAWFSPRRS